MAATSSTTNTTSASSSHEIVSRSVISTMHSALPGANTIRRTSGPNITVESSNNTPTTIVSIHECCETVPVITHHQHNGFTMSTEILRPNNLLAEPSSTSMISQHQHTLPDNSIIITNSSGLNMKMIQVETASTSVVEDCLPSTTLSRSTILMQSNNPESIIPTSPIATLSLESNNITCQTLGVANGKSKVNTNTLFVSGGCNEDELILDNVSHSTSVNNGICEDFGATVNGVVQKSSCAVTSIASPAPSKAGQIANECSSIDNFAMNPDSLSSESCDIDVKSMPLDEHEGYQDNTSSNSQQSAGGGSVSGGGGISGNGSSGYISLIPPPVGTTASGTTQCSEQLDFKHLFEELCPVCGDKVSGYHYGLLTCESCKGFFKRTVQNKKVYTCVAERSCHIDKTQRKRCPYCRFQKCLEVGMKLEAVRADRMRGGRNKFGPMYKRDRARKLQMMRQRQLALQAIRGSMGTTEIKSGQLSPTGYQQTYPSMNIKQEIQIPQVSSLTQSPDSSPSPIAIALGQVNPSTAVIATSLSGSGTNATLSGSSGNGGGHSHESGSGTSLQHTSESKFFDTGTNPSSTADSGSCEPLRVSPMIREFVQSIDDREWQTQLFTLLQKQSYNQVEVDLFELMCKVLDQNLFSQVDWARNTIFFKDLKVDDQMKLLQNSWSDMLVLDHLHHRIHNGLPDETQLNNGQLFNLLGLGLLGVPQLAPHFNELQNKLQELKFDMGDYVCMKFLILLNPNVRGIFNRRVILEGHENVQAALLDYTLTCYPSVTDKFSRLLSILPDIHTVAIRGEEHLYVKHCAGSAPTQTLLMEMLHAKRKANA